MTVDELNKERERLLGTVHESLAGWLEPATALNTNLDYLQGALIRLRDLDSNNEESSVDFETFGRIAHGLALARLDIDQYTDWLVNAETAFALIAERPVAS